MEFFKRVTPIGFMGYARGFGVLSLLLVLLSWGLIATKGFNLGIDFAGGTLIQVKYDETAPIDKIRAVLNNTKNYNGAQVTNFGDDKEIVIKTKSSSGAVANDVSDEISKILKPTGNFEIRRVDMVGPKIGDELKTKGLLALVVALAGILIYVSFRFEWRFALASVVALIHDASITMGAIALFGIEVNLDILAAILTLLGYSINDTIIVFDRIREGILTSKESDLNRLIDSSVTKTLSRTTLTSLTTFFVILSLYLFGGEIISGFGFTLLVGIVIGTYSSIFIASPLLIWLGFSMPDFRAKLVAKEKRAKEKEKMRAMYEKGTI